MKKAKGQTKREELTEGKKGVAKMMDKKIKASESRDIKQDEKMIKDKIKKKKGVK